MLYVHLAALHLDSLFSFLCNCSSIGGMLIALLSSSSQVDFYLLSLSFFLSFFFSFFFLVVSTIAKIHPFTIALVG